MIRISEFLHSKKVISETIMTSNAERGIKIPQLQFSGTSQNASLLLTQENLHSLQNYTIPINTVYSL